MMKNKLNAWYLFFQRKTNLRQPSKKRKYGAITIKAGLTIAIIIAIAVFVPLAGTSKPSTTNTTEIALRL